MTSREKILEAVQSSQPDLRELPNLDLFYKTYATVEQDRAKFIQTVQMIGAKAYEVNGYEEIIKRIKSDFEITGKRVVSAVRELDQIAQQYTATDNHELANVELMILPTHFAVAENGACWVDDELFEERLLLFIPQHLVFIVKKDQIVPNLHQAYRLIADKKYGYGAFVAGPSKTADIEQSLVLGAHGPRSLTVFML
ncbi:LUD domain-containing protein [Pedobacter sp. SD-b]|uniref:LUD domain-containing protein n=1 Tax=Pedobacter segetis TaxID=2793069 RepID=A0ABS1BJ48_9SPHI|nr:LUD domain-containing protein [Pedobacter segetis]MBK0382890.1 LUD domain-containing protein [Pedobacter segetis]